VWRKNAGRDAGATGGERLVGEEAGLGGGGGGGFAAGDADDAEDGEFGEGRAGDEDAVGARVEVGRGDVEAVVEEAEEVVGDDAFEGVAVDEAEADPEAVELWAAEEGFALGFEVVGELADEIDGADFGERDFLVFAVGGEQVDGVGFTEAGRVQIAADALAIGKSDDNFLVRRGWGARFQFVPGESVRPKLNYLRNRWMYVMLIGICLSSHCFDWG
jgi:hypothetical protein